MERSLMACPECDLLQRADASITSGTVRCRRCSAILSRGGGGIDRSLAYICASAIIFAIANVFPVLVLEGEGARTATTVAGTVYALWAQEMRVIALVVLVTVIVAPAVEIALLLCILVKLKVDGVSPLLAHLIRMVQGVRPWQMLEVFMLGVLVSWVKLGQIATVIPGIALWAFGILIFLLPAAATGFDLHGAWQSGRSFPDPS